MTDSAPANSPAPATEQAAQAPDKQFIDFGDEKVDLDTLKKERNKYKAADSKFREVAAARKEIDAFYHKLQNNPEELLNDPKLPIKKRELAEKWLMEQLEADLGQPQDPREIELAEYKKKLEEYQNREKEELTKREQAEYQALVEQRREHIATTLSKAMELSPLSKDPEVAAATLREMAAYLRMTRQAGYEASPEEIAQHVESRHMNSIARVVAKLDGDELLAFADKLGLTDKVRKADLSRLQRSREQPAPQVVHDWQSSSGKPKRDFVTPDSLRRR